MQTRFVDAEFVEDVGRSQKAAKSLVVVDWGVALSGFVSSSSSLPTALHIGFTKMLG
jgi:hypothetical protein